jgi:nitrite reductase/ring-hydroxylating ferredoxin subunit
MTKQLTTVDASCAGPCACGGEKGEAMIGRRQFVAFGAVALAAAALAACSAGMDLTSPGTVSATSFKLSDFPTLATVGGVTTTTVGGVPIAIVRMSASSFAAFSRICPHQGSTINVTSNGFVCPNHGAEFNSSGQWIGGQRTSNLTSYPVAYDSTAGTLTIGS